MKPIFRAITILLISLLISGVFSGVAISAEGDVQTLVDEIQALADKSRKERAADRWLQNALEDLVAKYNYPWRDSLFSDDFSDGDYRQNPTWEVSTGQFWIDRRLGLRSQVTPQVQSTQPAQTQDRQRNDNDLGRVLLGALAQQLAGQQRRETSSNNRPTTQTVVTPASIRTQVAIPTTFAVESIFSQNNRPGETGSYEWIVMQDDQASNAYKLLLTTGNKPTIELVRVRSSRDSFLEVVDVPSLNDGGEHTLSWRQMSTGEISVFVDGQEVIKSTDRPFRYGFKYLGLVNRGGDFSITGIEVLGGR